MAEKKKMPFKKHTGTCERQDLKPKSFGAAASSCVLFFFLVFFPSSHLWIRAKINREKYKT
jgi:hypothetical protein